MNKKRILYLVLTYANIPVILYFWWQGSGGLALAGKESILSSLGRLAGLLSVFFVLYQIILIGRTGWLEKVWGLDRLAQVHRLNGFMVAAFLIAHPVLLTFGYKSATGLTAAGQFRSFVQNYEDVGQAALALLLFLFIIGYSIFLVRKKVKYELWYYSHLLTYLAIALAFGHQVKLGGVILSSKVFAYYWYALYIFTFANLVYYRFYQPLRLFRKHGFYVKEIADETPDVTSIYISGEKMDEYKVKAGQFMILRFLAKGFWWQAHPFSLSVEPNGKYLRFSIKNVGDFTSQIKSLAPGAKVIIEGPFGTFTTEQSKNDKLLFIAGGIGITPIRSLIGYLAPRKKDIVLLYGNRTEKDIVFRQELDEMAQKHGFLVNYVLSGQSDWQGEKGKVDKEKITKLAPDFQKREVYLCGPVLMMKQLSKDLKDKGISPGLIHYEKFSL